MTAILRSRIIDREPRYFTLSLELFRVIGGWDADCAERAIAVYEARPTSDTRRTPLTGRTVMVPVVAEIGVRSPSATSPYLWSL